MLKKILNYLYLFFSQYTFFWLLREKKDKLVFTIKKFLYTFKDSLIKRMQTSVFYICSIILTTYILQIINPYIDYWLKALLHGYLKSENVKFDLNLIANSEYITFLTAIAAIGGVFVGLYFSSLSGINATLYSTFSKDLRDLLYRDKISNRYIRNLSFTTFFAFTLIVFFLLGFEKIYIAIPILLILIGYTIFSYFKMGNRMHELLNTDTLSHSIFKNLFKYIDNAVKDDIYKKDKAFQSHYSKLASQEIKLLTSLIETSLENYKTHNTSFQNITLNIFNLLIYYQVKKRLIPHDSLWYRQEYEYKDLYKMGNFSNLNIFLQNGMMPQGTNKSNLFWIEDKIMNYVIKILINKIKNDEIEDFQNLLGHFLEYLKILVKYGNIEYSIKIIEQLKKEIYSYDSIEKSKLILLTDYTYSLPIEIILEFIKNIKIYSYENILKIVENNDLSEDLVRRKFSENLSESLSWLQEKLKLEIAAEGKEITPKWYQAEFLILTQSRIFIENIESINNLLEKFFNHYSEDIDSQVYATMLNRKWESINKYIIHFNAIENILKEYLEKRKNTDFEWKKFSIEKLNSKNILLKKSCIVEIGDALNIIKERDDSTQPDIKGFFLQITGDNLINLAIDKNFEDLQNVYLKFLVSSLFKYYDMKPSIDTEEGSLDFRKENELVFSFIPIMNLFEITGLIKIILEFYNETETWEIVENYWLNLFRDEKKLIDENFIPIVISITESRMGLAPGDEQRHTWDSKVRRYLKEHIKNDIHTKIHRGPMPVFDEEEIVLHENVLIREYIGRDRYTSNVDGIDIFIHSILRKNFKEKDFKFGRKEIIGRLKIH